MCAWHSAPTQRQARTGGRRGTKEASRREESSHRVEKPDLRSDKIRPNSTESGNCVLGDVPAGGRLKPLISHGTVEGTVDAAEEVP
jgi:hypothetical protein